MNHFRIGGSLGCTAASEDLAHKMHTYSGDTGDAT